MKLLRFGTLLVFPLLCSCAASKAPLTVAEPVATSPTQNIQQEEKKPEPEKTEEVVWKIDTQDKVVALTFDDGPSPKYTPQLLALLKQYDVHATFFLVGENVEKHPELVQQEVSAGHEIGNHTYTHTNINQLSAEQFHEEVKKTSEAIERVTGNKTHFFRPPEGARNEIMMKETAKDDLVTIMWDEDSQDWKKPGVNKIISNVLPHLKGGNIILFHDHAGEQNQKSLQKLIPELKQQGYRFVTISELMKYKK
ncbi:MAG TPA: polysaccharide deacetylase family protein [Bacillota bacterium]|nr:polysaccharide deacetylase family protein [Bacillota bacterium]